MFNINALPFYQADLTADPLNKFFLIINLNIQFCDIVAEKLVAFFLLYNA